MSTISLPAPMRVWIIDEDGNLVERGLAIFYHEESPKVNDPELIGVIVDQELRWYRAHQVGWDTEE